MCPHPSALSLSSFKQFSHFPLRGKWNIIGSFPNLIHSFPKHFPILLINPFHNSPPPLIFSLLFPLFTSLFHHFPPNLSLFPGSFMSSEIFFLPIIDSHFFFLYSSLTNLFVSTLLYGKWQNLFHKLTPLFF